MKINISDYDGACFEENGFWVYVVVRKGVDVVRIPRLEAWSGTLYCDFQALDPELSLADVKNLIYVVLLGKLLRRFYLGKVNSVTFRNLATGVECQDVYIGREGQIGRRPDSTRTTQASS